MIEIHKKIRELRLQKGLTLKQLSEKTNLTIGFLSQVERGTSSLAITSLKKIADSLGVEISYFFNPAITAHYAVKKENQKTFTVEGNATKYIRLSGNFHNRNLECMLVTLQPFQKDDQTFSHMGEEFYYVLKGEVIFKIDNNEYHLMAGESIHFPSEKTHQWENPTGEETVLISVLTPILF